MNDSTALWINPPPIKESQRRAWARPDAASAPLRFLVVPQQTRIEVTHPDVVVGRHSLAEVRLADPDVSRRHCRLVLVDGVWRVQDLNSLNGVYLNGQRIEDAALYEGDRLCLGGCTLIVEQATTLTKRDDQEAKMLQSIAEAIAPDYLSQAAG